MKRILISMYVSDVEIQIVRKYFEDAWYNAPFAAQDFNFEFEENQT